jgi:hypothetical protein
MGKTANRRRERSGSRSCREDRHADREHPASAEPIAQRAAGQQQHGEAERIGVHCPLQAGDLRAEVGTDCRERDRHHEPVQREREQCQRRNRERPPQPWLGIHLNSMWLDSTPSTPLPAAAFTASL